MIRTLEEVQGSRLAVNIREVAFAGNELTVRLTVDGALPDDGLLSNEQVRHDIAQAAMKRNLEAQLDEALARARTAEANLRTECARVTELEDELGSATRWAHDLEVQVDRYRKAHVCTVECKPNQHTAFQGRRRVTELEAELERRTEERDERERARAALEAQLESERNRADQNKAWAERAERHLDEKSSALANQARLLHGENGVYARLAAATSDRKRLGKQLNKISDAVERPEIAMALDKGIAWPDDHVRTLIDAVSEVRQALYSPEPGTSPA